MKLRNMSASVHNMPKVIVKVHETGEVLTLRHVTILRSYESDVAIYAGGRVYLLPRYGYSNTTWKHLHAFVQDFCNGVPDLCAKDMRASAKRGTTCDGWEYCFIDGYQLDGYPFWLSH